MNTSCRARYESIRFGENDSRLVEGFHKTGGYDSHNSLVPQRIIYYGGVFGRHTVARAHHFQCLLGNLPVDILPLVVVFVDFVADSHSCGIVLGGKQFHCNPSGFHPAGRINARTYLEHDIVNCNVARVKS